MEELSVEIKPDLKLKSYYFAGFWLGFIPIIFPLVILGLVLNYPANLVMWISAIVTVLIAIPLIFWIPAYFSRLAYSIEDDCVRGKKGVFFRKNTTVPYTKITNVDVTQGPLQRMFEIGTLHVQTAGAAGAQGYAAELKIEGIKDFESLRETIIEKVKGFTLKNKIEPSAVQEADEKSLVFIAMLDELKAIRKNLEK